METNVRCKRLLKSEAVIIAQYNYLSTLIAVDNMPQ